MGRNRRKIKLSFKRKFVCMILLFVMLSVIASVQATATTTITIPATTASQNSFATLPITVTAVENYGTGTINLEYDPAVVHVTNVSDAPAGTSTVTAWTADNTAGIARISAWNIAGVSGDVIFARVEFHAVGTAETSTPLKLTVSILQDTAYNDIPAAVVDGAFNIGKETDTGALTPTPPQGKIIPGFEIVFVCLALLVVYPILCLRRKGGK